MQASPQDILDDLQRQTSAWPAQDAVQDDLDPVRRNLRALPWLG